MDIWSAFWSLGNWRGFVVVLFGFRFGFGFFFFGPDNNQLSIAAHAYISTELYTGV